MILRLTGFRCEDLGVAGFWFGGEGCLLWSQAPVLRALSNLIP